MLASLECSLEAGQCNINDSKLRGNLLHTFHALVEDLALLDKIPSILHCRRDRLTCVLGSVAVHVHVIKGVVGELNDEKKAPQGNKIM